jgi:hypothetical protein
MTELMGGDRGDGGETKALVDDKGLVLSLFREHQQIFPVNRYLPSAIHIHPPCTLIKSIDDKQYKK